MLSQRSVGKLEILLNRLFFYEVQGRRIISKPLLSTRQYHQLLYQANIPDKLLSLIQSRYGWKPSVFLPQLYDGRAIAALHWNEYGEPEVENDDVIEGRLYFLIFAHIAIRRGWELPAHLPEARSATADLVDSLVNDGFECNADGIVPKAEGVAAVPQPTLVITSEVVELALRSAETAVKNEGPRAAVDRVHTVMHGYLQEICKQANIAISPDDGITKIFKTIRENHPKLSGSVPGAAEVGRIVRNLSATLDAFNPIRNHASLAHPNTLLEDPEAMLVINIARTLLHYFDTRLS